MLNLTLRLVLHGNELTRASVNIVPLRPLPEVFVLLVSYAAFEQLFLLCHQNSLHAQRALLLLKLGLAHTLCMLLLGPKVGGTYLL